MTYKELIKSVSETTGYKQSFIRRVLNEAGIQIESSLDDGEKVSLGKFGFFTKVRRASRKGRNPKTGEVFPVPAHYEAVFNNGTQLKKYINKGETK